MKVQTKPLQVLAALVNRPGELVTREELCRELWPDGTFVDFESGLNTATNRLRVALNDSAERPLYIETLPRLGYRFIYPVTEVANENTREDAPVHEHVTGTTDAVPPEVVGHTRLPRTKYAIPALICCAALLLAAVWAGRFFKAEGPVFHPVTYREQVIRAARFLPASSDAVVFTTFASGEGSRTFRIRLRDMHMQTTLLFNGFLVSVSKLGHLAAFAPLANQSGWGLLEISSKDERKVLEAQQSGSFDWLPDGHSFAFVHREGAQSVVEFPSGRVAYRSAAWITDLRASPDGRQVAFCEHPIRDDDAGQLRILDQNGATKLLTQDWNSIGGIAWSPNGREIWFTASKAAASRSLYAVSLASKLRQIDSIPSSLRLFDISKTGQALISVDDNRGAMWSEFPHSGKEIDLTEFDEPGVDAISADGERLLFTESGDAGGQHYTCMVFDHFKQSSRFVSHGRCMALSPDGHLVIVLDPKNNTALSLLDLSTGGSKRVSGEDLRYQWARFLSNNSIVAGGSLNGGPLKLYSQSLDGRVTPLSNLPYVDYPVIAPGGGKLAGISGKDVLILDLCKKTATRLPKDQLLLPAGWSHDGQSLFLADVMNPAARLVKYEFNKRSLTTWKPFRTAPAASLGEVGAIAVAPESGSYAYSLHQDLSRLYVVDGWS